MRREGPPLKLQRSPLVYVLSQVRFPAILKMDTHLPDIQEDLRRTGFVRYNKEDIQQVVFGGPEVRAEHGTRWVFSSRDRSEAVVLAPGFVVYETSKYDVFETFSSRFYEVLNVVSNRTKIELVEKLGLRYIDLIRTAEGRSAKEFLREHVRGLAPEDLGAKKSRHQFVIQAETDQGDLLVRSFENSGPDFLPPDLVSTHTHLDFPVAREDLGRDTYRILDIDHIAKGEFDFDPSTLIDKLWELHACASRAFLAAVTEEAIEYWKKEGNSCLSPKS